MNWLTSTVNLQNLQHDVSKKIERLQVVKL